MRPHSRGVVADSAARTVTIRLSAPDGDFLTKLAMPWAYAVPVGTRETCNAARAPCLQRGRTASPATERRRRRIGSSETISFREWSADAQPDGFPDVITVSERFGFLESDRVRAVRRGVGDVAIGGGPPIPDRTSSSRSPPATRADST